MAEQRGSKRLTRADALVIAVVGLLLIFLVPVLFAKPREQAVRRLCAANLTQIGKAMFSYANDYEDELPRAGGRSSVWGPTTNWMAIDRRAAFGLAADGSGGTASISSCFYLLVKYLDMSPRVFVCKGDKGTTEFTLADRPGVPPSITLAGFWDFSSASESFKHCSYAYHIPFGLYSLTTSSDPNLAVAADRNPWIKSPAADPSVWADFRPDVSYPGGTPGISATARKGNSTAHQLDGQNVLFLDGRVTFENRAYCGIDKDNIYTLSRMWPEGEGDPYGTLPVAVGTLTPSNAKDSVLVHDPPIFASWDASVKKR
jgi:hypothetical protein